MQISLFKHCLRKVFRTVKCYESSEQIVSTFTKFELQSQEHISSFEKNVFEY